MIMVEQNKKTVGEVLLGKNESLGIIEAYRILEGPGGHDGVEEVTKEVLNAQFIRGHEDNLEAFPKIIEALFTKFDTEGDAIIEEMAKHYARLVHAYPLGIILGVFRGIQAVPFSACRSRCTAKLSDLFLQLVFGSTSFDPKHKDQHPGMLCEAVSSYLRPKKPLSGDEKKSRIEGGFKFIAQVNKILSTNPPLPNNKSFLSVFGGTFVEEFSFKLFSDLSPSQKVEALTLYDSTGRTD